MSSLAPAGGQSSPLEADEGESEPPQQYVTIENQSASQLTSTASDQILGQVAPSRASEQSPRQNTDSWTKNLVSSSLPVASHLSSSLSSNTPLSPLRQFPAIEVEVDATIPEESDETDCDTPNEPVTPLSGRQSRDGVHHTVPDPNPGRQSPPETTNGTAIATIPIPIGGSTASSYQNHSHSHTHHGHKQHKHHHTQPSLPHQRNTADPNVLAGGELQGVFYIDTDLPEDESVAVSPPEPTSPVAAQTLQPSQHTLPLLSTTGLSPKQANTAARPETPATRPTTAVAGNFIIGATDADVDADANTDLATRPEARASIGTNAERNITAPAILAPVIEPPSSPTHSRRPRGSSSATSFKRTMSNLFRRSNSQSEKVAFGVTDYGSVASDTNLADLTNNGTNRNMANSRKTPNRRWSMNRSLATPQSVSPPSPGTPPLEMARDTGPPKTSNVAAVASPTGASSGADTPVTARRNPSVTGLGDRVDVSLGGSSLPQRGTIPTPEDFFQNDNRKQQQRASTGLSFHNAIYVVTGSSGTLGGRRNKNKNRTGINFRRRASSFEHGSHNPPVEIGGELWALPAEAGTGLKARRMSLSLPDDFTVDVADLHSEFDYQHVLGRHRRHLGKGATSKVTLMFRRGFPDELYAVKEFRGKSSSETREEYEKKVKSEYSIAKSLHHPNIVETVRLCSDHGRWNHVMEYCQEGDLYSLVERKYLLSADREKDRLCLFKQLLQGLNYLHSHGIAHRDIKLENLLITNSSKLKITDFGASDVFSGIHPGLREAGGQCGYHIDDSVRLCRPGICGSLPYISPEVLEADKPYDPRKLDVWAAAVVMLHLIFGGPLWSEARIRPGQPNAQYASLLRGWEKWNANHLAVKQDAEKQHAEKQEAERLQAEKQKADMKAVNEKTNGGGMAGDCNTSKKQAPVASEGNGPPSIATTTNEKPTAVLVNNTHTSQSHAETVTAAPLTDGNPNSIVEGPYPTVMAMDACVNPPVLRRILIQMLNPDPKRRVTIEQVTNLRWIRNVECCQQDSYDDPVAQPAPTGAVRTIDASKRSTGNFSSQKIYCHDHLPPKAHPLARIV